MPRIRDQHREKTALFSKLSEESRSVGETNDCTVKALAVVTGLPYAKCHAALEKAGRQKGKGAFQHEQNKALKFLGFRVKRVTPSEIIALYPGVHRGLQNVTTHHPDRFPRAFEGRPPMLFYTSGHVAAFRDGKLHDWTRGRAMRAVAIYEVHPIEGNADERQDVLDL